jgi:antitoxin component YwqK of YwqJK toxin-antitoxin module
MFSTYRSNFDVINKTDDFSTIKYTDEDLSEYIYQGKVDLNDKFNGYGKLWNQDYSYHGNFIDNKMEGDGILTYIKTNEKLDNTFPIYYKGKFKNNKKNGPGIEKYANKEFYEGTFLNDFRHGDGILYNHNGQPKINSNWELGRSVNTRYITEYYKNGNLEYKGNFNGITRDGKGTLFNINGTILFDGEFDNGKFKKGKIYSDNFIIFEGSFNDNKIDHGIFYHDNGLVQCSGKVEYKDSKYYITRKTKLYDSSSNLIFDGDLISVDNVSSNMLKISPIKINDIYYNINIGNGTLYHNQNNDKDMVNFKPIHSHIIKINENYNFDGDNISYFPNGNIKEIKPYNNGKLEGIHREFSDCEKILVSTTYKNSIKNGEHIRFTNDGNIAIKINYINGIPDVLQLYYSNNKKKYEGKCIIINNEIKYQGIGKLYYDNNNNSLKYEGTFDKGLYENNGTSYHQNGHKSYEGGFNKGRHHGNGISFYETTGTIEYDGQWVTDERHGEGALWDESGAMVFQGVFQYGDMHFN